MNTLEPKIYVACLAAYSNGYLHGQWIEANQDAECLHQAVKEMLARSPMPNAEEWAIHGYEDFGGVSIGESTSFETVSEIAAFIVAHGELGAGALRYMGGDRENAQQLLEECYRGEFDTEVDFVQSLAEETMNIPDDLAYYIDYEKMARDWFINDFFSIEVNGKTHVFSYS
jgi:antirestriction protein